MTLATFGKYRRRRGNRSWHAGESVTLRAELLEGRLLPSLTPTLLSDINPGSTSSNPGFFAQVNNLAFFTASDGIDGTELWRSDGSNSGTFMVSDIRFPFLGSYPGNLTNVSGTLFFSANDGTHGAELWESNGIAAGTFLVKDINPGTSGSSPSRLMNMGGTLFFAASDGIDGTELWRSDGTNSGTFMVSDIRFPFLGSYPDALTNIGGTLFFTANDGIHGTELWRTDGTAAHTSLVKDIDPGTASSRPSAEPLYTTMNVNGTLFFDANDGTNGDELWRSDGTATGTVLVKDIHPGSASSYPDDLKNVNGTLFFNAGDGTHGDEEWRSDGTASGTFLIKDINPGVVGSYPLGTANVNGILFFAALDGSHGKELWQSDGTAGGTSLVDDIKPGATGSYPFDLTNVSGQLFFETADSTNGGQLWASDGLPPPAGTFSIAPIAPPSNSFSQDLTNVNGALFFVANDLIHGFEPWVLPWGTDSSTIVSSSPNPSSFGQSVTFTAVVNVAPRGTPSGTVDFKEGSTDLTPGGVNLSGNRATFSTATLPVGFHTITALYGGDNNFFGSQGDDSAAPQRVNAASTTTSLVSVSGSSVYGEPASFIAFITTVAPGTPTGTVNFMEGSTILAANVSLTNGHASVSTANLPLGTHTITAFYSGDGTFQPSNASSTQAVSQASTITDVTASPNPSVVGQAIVFTAAVRATITSGAPSTVTPTGTVDFKEGTTDLTPGGVSLSGNQATFATSALGVGSHVVLGVYSGDANLLASAGFTPLLTVNAAATNTLLRSSSNPSVLNQTITFTATISPASGAGSPTGVVDFRELSADFPPKITDLTPGGVTLNGTQATFSTSALTLGSHTITAVYGGDSTFAGSQGDDSTSPQVVNNASSATSLVSIPGKSVFGQSVVFVAFVSPVAPATSTPTGTVTFIDGFPGKGGATLAANVGFSGGYASFSTASLAVGNHNITAVYSGDANLLASSATTVEFVSKTTTSTALTSSPNPSVFGQNVIFTATVLAQGGGIPTGTVDFTEASADLTPAGVALVGGRATFLTASLPVGHHTITATYSGNANYSASQGNDSAAPAVVNQATSRTVIFSFPDPSVFGQVVPFTVSVTALSPGRGTPTGSVVFTDFTTTIGSVSLSAGRATFSIASLSRGNHAISANYGGDGNFLTSAYTNYGQPVQKAATTTTVTPSANPVVVGQTLTLTATVQASSPGAGTPTGTVTFKDITTVLGTGTLNASAQATFTTSALSLGTHAITASYAGDNNFTASVSPITAEVINSSARATAVVSATTSDQSRVTASAAINSSPVRGLSAQRVDDFFGAVGRQRRVRPLPAVPVRPLLAGADWLGPAL